MKFKEKEEPFSQGEYNGLVSLGKARLKDANITSLSLESSLMQLESEQN